MSTDGTTNTLAFCEIVAQGPGTFSCCAWIAYGDGIGTQNGINAPLFDRPPTVSRPIRMTCGEATLSVDRRAITRVVPTS